MRSTISTILVALLSMPAAACVLGPDLHSARSVAGGAYCPPLQPLNSPNAQRRVEAPDLEASPVRDSLVLAWRQSGRLGDDLAHPSSSRAALYFGEGGVYDADGLDDRAHMLSQVSELVNLMTYDLHHLATAAATR